MSTNEIQRRHFRFPAFNDEEGVKINPSKERVILGDDELLTRYTEDNVTAPRPKERTMDHFDDENTVKAPAMEREKSAHGVTLDEERKFYEAKKELPNHLSPKLPKEENKGIPIKRHPVIYSESPKEMPRRSSRYGLEVNNKRPLSLKQQYSGGVSRFRSRADETPPPRTRLVPKPRFTRDELVTSMAKKKDSYLLLDEKTLPKKKTVEQPKEKLWRAPAPRVSASQSKPIVTQTNKEQTKKPVKAVAVAPAREKTIYSGSKKIKLTTNRSQEETAIGKKKSALERGLSGIMEQENKSSQRVNNRFFDEKKESSHLNN
ncbi:MAG: hypothetical protein LBM95_06555 [Lactobacillales bacterium]|jgi:hypothetical protein|nr:hypothetical protein [Lactobacillales bacterium]